jgi:hypothetical protein
MPLARITKEALMGLKGRLKDFFSFYNTYDPAFTWWVPAPYKALDAMRLDRYSDIALSKGKVITTQKPDSSGIKGVPIGSDGADKPVTGRNDPLYARRTDQACQ